MTGLQNKAHMKDWEYVEEKCNLFVDLRKQLCMGMTVITQLYCQLYITWS